MKFVSKIAFMVLAGLLAAACSKQNAERYSDGLIHVRVDAEQSKSSIYTATGLQTAPGKFIMEAYVDRDVYTSPTGTSVSTHVGTPYFAPDAEYLPQNVEFDPVGNEWKLFCYDRTLATPKQSCYWVSSDGNMSFWSRVKSQNGLNDITIDTDNSALYLTSPNVDDTKGVKMVFDYSLPTPTLESNPSATSLIDATNQEDLIFAYWQDALENTTPDADEPTYPEYQDVWVHFYHALTQIRFCFSNNDGSFENGLQIKSIAIDNVASGGTCTFWGNLAMNEFVNKDPYQASNNTRDVASLFTWSDLKSSKTYRQDYGVTINTDTESYTGWRKGTYSKESVDYNLFTCENVFMMIPQTLTSGACVRLTVVDNTKPEDQREQEFVSYLKPLGEAWEAGKYYTYKLNYQNNQISFTLLLADWGIVSGDRKFTIQ